MTLYRDIVETCISWSYHESDLYIEDTEHARKILAKYPQHEKNAKRFQGADKSYWIDVPFAYDPFWEKKAKR